MRILSLLIFALILTACTTSQGFDRGQMKRQLSELGAPRESKDQNINEILALKPQLPRPAKIAVYFRPNNHGGWKRGWQWLADDKERLLKLGAELKQRSLVSDLFILGDEVVLGEGNLRNIRIAAARLGADAVLIVQGTDSVDKYNNVLGGLYFALVPMIFTPGTVLDALFFSNAALWDVRNEYLYLYGEGEGMASQTRPWWFIEDNLVIAEAKSKAMDALQKNIMERIAVLAPN